MMIHDVHQGIRKNKAKKRIGRGPGSGHGKTSGRGHNGFFSRAGSSKRTGFAGGTTPVFMRVAKRGFSNAKFRLNVAAVNVSRLEIFDAGTEITPEFLKDRGFTNGPFDEVKILGDGELTKKLFVTAHRFSGSAKQKIEAAGGTATVIERAKPESKKQRTAAALAEEAGDVLVATTRSGKKAARLATAKAVRAARTAEKVAARAAGKTAKKAAPVVESAAESVADAATGVAATVAEAVAGAAAAAEQALTSSDDTADADAATEIE